MNQVAFPNMSHKCNRCEQAFVAPADLPSGGADPLDFRTASTTAPKTARPNEQLPIPPWAWVFVIACGIIPVITLGGAIPGAIGFGGAGGCLAVARNPSLDIAARIGICVAITAACWVGLFALVGGVAMMQQRR